MYQRKTLKQVPEPLDAVLAPHGDQDAAFLPGQLCLLTPGKHLHLFDIKRILQGHGLPAPILLLHFTADRLGTADYHVRTPAEKPYLLRIPHIHIAADPEPHLCPAAGSDIGQIGRRPEAVRDINLRFLLQFTQPHTASEHIDDLGDHARTAWQPQIHHRNALDIVGDAAGIKNGDLYIKVRLQKPGRSRAYLFQSSLMQGRHDQ